MNPFRVPDVVIIVYEIPTGLTVTRQIYYSFSGRVGSINEKFQVWWKSGCIAAVEGDPEDEEARLIWTMPPVLVPNDVIVRIVRTHNGQAFSE